MEQLDLAVLQFQGGSALGLSDVVQPVADNGDYEVRRLRFDQGPSRGKQPSDPVENRDRCRPGMLRSAGTGHLSASQAPVAQLGKGRICVGADQREFPGPGWIEGKQSHAVLSLVPEQYEAFPGSPEGNLPMRDASDPGPYPLRITEARILEQAHAEFQVQHSAYHRVQLRYGQQPALQGLPATVEKFGSGHDQVVAGLQGHRGGFGVIGADALVVDQVADVVPVGDQYPLEAPFLLEDGGQEPAAGRAGHAVYGLVAGHEGHRTGFRGPFERRKEGRTEFPRTQFGLRRVASPQGLRIAGVVLGRGQDGVGVGKTPALVAADHGNRQLSDQQRIFAEGLPDASPA